jgi:integrase
MIADNPYIVSGKLCIYTIYSVLCPKSIDWDLKAYLLIHYARGVRTIQKISGHSSLSTLSLYLEVTDESVRDLASKLIRCII